jgi:hypothetical protein
MRGVATPDGREGQPTFLDPEEAKLADELHHAVLNRPWEYWLRKHGG